jgi:hypothetical protein
MLRRFTPDTRGVRATHRRHQHIACVGQHPSNQHVQQCSATTCYARTPPPTPTPLLHMHSVTSPVLGFFQALARRARQLLAQLQASCQAGSRGQTFLPLTQCVANTTPGRCWEWLLINRLKFTSSPARPAGPRATQLSPRAPPPPPAAVTTLLWSCAALRRRRRCRAAQQKLKSRQSVVSCATQHEGPHTGCSQTSPPCPSAWLHPPPRKMDASSGHVCVETQGGLSRTTTPPAKGARRPSMHTRLLAVQPGSLGAQLLWALPKHLHVALRGAVQRLHPRPLAVCARCSSEAASVQSLLLGQRSNKTT